MFSVFCKKRQEGIIKPAHCRKNRRFQSQVTSAMILRTIDVICSQGDNLKSQIYDLSASHKRKLHSWKSGLETSAQYQQRVAEINLLLPQGAKVEVSASSSPESLKIRQLICEKIRELARHSPNMRYLAKKGFLEVLIPFTGYKILARRGQTEVLDKFWFCNVGLLHGTNKINYQENLLWYALGK